MNKTWSTSTDVISSTIKNQKSDRNVETGGDVPPGSSGCEGKVSSLVPVLTSGEEHRATNSSAERFPHVLAHGNGCFLTNMSSLKGKKTPFWLLEPSEFRTKTWSRRFLQKGSTPRLKSNSRDLNFSTRLRFHDWSQEEKGFCDQELRSRSVDQGIASRPFERYAAKYLKQYASKHKSPCCDSLCLSIATY